MSFRTSRAGLGTSLVSLGTSQTSLRNSHEKLRTSQTSLRISRARLRTSRQKLGTSRTSFRISRTRLRTSQARLRTSLMSLEALTACQSLLAQGVWGRRFVPQWGVWGANAPHLRVLSTTYASSPNSVPFVSKPHAEIRSKSPQIHTVKICFSTVARLNSPLATWIPNLKSSCNVWDGRLHAVL